MASIVKEDQISADLDRGADVLYLALGKPRPDEGEDREGGIILRYGVSDDRPSGVTVIGYVEAGWSTHIVDLAKIVSAHLPVGVDEVIRTIQLAEGNR